MKKTSLIILSVFIMSTLFAQNDGAITPDVLSKIKKSYDIKDANTRALTNAISNNDISKLALNRAELSKINHDFKYKVNVKGISNQESSGRCWMFTSMNVLRPKVIDKYGLSQFEFSQNYLYFWDQIEKCNLFLHSVIKYADKPMDDKYNDWLFSSPINDGGVWNSYTNLAEKYGLVPTEVMPETYQSNKTNTMVKLITRKLREDGLTLREMIKNKAKAEKIETAKIEMLGEVYRILSLSLGEPPTEFEWATKDADGKMTAPKKYTPMSFMKEVLPEVNLNDYVLLMNDPTREYNKLYEIEYDRNVMEGKNWIFINLPADEIKKYAIESIKNNEAMYASCDVGKQLNRDNGTLNINNYDYDALLGVKFGMDKKQRIESHESGSSHGMALVAVDVDENEKSIKWQFENSWGSDSGHKGYLTFSDEWFSEYLFRIVVLKKFVDPKILKVLEQKPIMLPPWDPMFKADN